MQRLLNEPKYRTYPHLNTNYELSSSASDSGSNSPVNPMSQGPMGYRSPITAQSTVPVAMGMPSPMPGAISYISMNPAGYMVRTDVPLCVSVSFSVDCMCHASRASSKALVCSRYRCPF